MRLLWRVDAAWRLGRRPVALFLLHRLRLALGLPQRALARAHPPRGRFLPGVAPAAPDLPPGEAARLLRAAAALPERPDWHGPFNPAADALGLDLFGPGDVRPVWEASRFADLLVLVQAARLDPAGPHLAQAEARLAAWCAANPPFFGPAWACGQEAALRALALALALSLLQAEAPPASRALLERCARRIAATPAYAAAQDNNHAISEAAGAYACALLLRRDSAGHARRLARRVARLVAPDGGFAQVSAGYARLALDVLAVAEVLRQRHGAPAFPAPLPARAAALAAWLHQVTAAEDGSTPAMGVEDGSAFADLGLHGPQDARGSVERAARLFAGLGGDLPEEAGCAWLGLAVPAGRLARPARWRASGSQGWRSAGASAVLRGGRLRFRPAQADLLHLTLRDGPRAVLRDGGTGAYNPPAAWWWGALAGAAAHNAVVFDGTEPMPRAGRFLLARWPRVEDLPDGAWRRDAAGRVHARQVAVAGRVWTVTDRLSGRFRQAVLHWRLPAGPWRLTGEAATDGLVTIRVIAEQPPLLDLVQGWESPGYGRIAPCPLLRVTVAGGISRMTTIIALP
ncbi:heparinase II/III domain-containing protein [Falsiroseomonas selenitidurans]|uniref:heparinase II/III domain-containing protein n=1 Tax=Falsiroseomonas selenitidurans TaxID=2716335 RepID=UPI001F1D6F61|nr:heparinase II/III family protein [Falsiroseomonas selenitidurans]